MLLVNGLHWYVTDFIITPASAGCMWSEAFVELLWWPESWKESRMDGHFLHLPQAIAGLQTTVASMSAQIAASVVTFSTFWTHELQLASVKSLVGSQIAQLRRKNYVRVYLIL